MKQSQQLTQQLYDAMAGLKRVMMRSRDQLLGELQLTRTQIEVLMILIEKDAQTVGELAACLAVTHSAATQTIETLVKRSLVERVADDADRRLVRTRLSDTGRELAFQLHQSRMEQMSRAFAGLSDDELKVMVSVLERLSRQFDVKQLTEVENGN